MFPMIDITFLEVTVEIALARSTISKIEKFLWPLLRYYYYYYYYKKNFLYNKQIHNQSDEQQEKTGK